MPKSRNTRKTSRWADKQNRDPFVRKARDQGYRARAAYKLEQIDRKFRLIKPTTRLIDLGSAPGSWAQYALSKVQDPQQIVAIDLLPMTSIQGVHFIEGDFTDPAVADRVYTALGGHRLDLVLSDMAPNITGIRATDDARAEALQEAVLLFCERALGRGGSLLTKLFEGATANWMRQQLSSRFDSMQVIKPEASRAESREIFILARGYQKSLSETSN